MNEPESETILDLIDKIIGFADNQPLILNHLTVLRQRTEALEDRIRALEADAKNNDLAPLITSLQNELAAKQQEIAELKRQNDDRSAERPDTDAGIRKRYRHDDRIGWSIHLETQKPFCTKCLLRTPPVESPLTQLADSGHWVCQAPDCGNDYADERRIEKLKKDSEQRRR